MKKHSRKYLLLWYRKYSIYSTENGEVQCRCESTDHAWSGFSIGNAGNWPLFPIESLRLGDTGLSNEYIDFRVGPLVCKQGKRSDK